MKVYYDKDAEVKSRTAFRALASACVEAALPGPRSRRPDSGSPKWRQP